MAAKNTATDPIGPELKQLLRHPKLGRMLDTLPERLTLAHQRSLGHAEFLELVLADEHTRREAKSAQLRARAAGLDPACASTPGRRPPPSATTGNYGPS